MQSDAHLAILRAPSEEKTRKPSPNGAKLHGLCATGARAVERPRRWRRPGREAGVGVRANEAVRQPRIQIRRSRSTPHAQAHRCATPARDLPPSLRNSACNFGAGKARCLGSSKYTTPRDCGSTSTSNSNIAALRFGSAPPSNSASRYSAKLVAASGASVTTLLAPRKILGSAVSSGVSENVRPGRRNTPHDSVLGLPLKR